MMDSIQYPILLSPPSSILRWSKSKIIASFAVAPKLREYIPSLRPSSIEVNRYTCGLSESSDGTLAPNPRYRSETKEEGLTLANGTEPPPKRLDHGKDAQIAPSSQLGM